MIRNYNEVMNDLEERAEYELVVSTARVEGEDGESNVCLALITLDGVTRGKVTNDSLFNTLQSTAETVLLGEDAGVISTLRAAIDEVGFDRAIELLESQKD